jgi:hypothetical protein
MGGGAANRNATRLDERGLARTERLDYHSWIWAFGVLGERVCLQTSGNFYNRRLTWFPAAEVDVDTCRVATDNKQNNL